MTEEQLEQEELGAGQLDAPLAAADRVGDGIQLDVAEAERRAVGARHRAAQQGAHSRQQLVEGERLHEVVVRAGVEAGDTVRHGVARGEHQHRGAVALQPHPAAELEPVHARHEHVQHDRVGSSLAERHERLAAVSREQHVVAVQPQCALHRLAHGGLVVDNQNAHRGPA